jgi:hypothetical protein
MPGTKGHSGGPREGAGRRGTDNPVTTLRLRPKYRRMLAVLTAHQRNLRNDPRLSQRALLEEWIEEKWREFDASVIDAEEKINE